MFCEAVSLFSMQMISSCRAHTEAGDSLLRALFVIMFMITTAFYELVDIFDGKGRLQKK